jgi:hypothetical protein
MGKQDADAAQPPTPRKVATMQAHEFQTPQVIEEAHASEAIPIATIRAASTKAKVLAGILAVPDGTSHKPVLEYSA